ncbi:thiamine pyrophosphate-dependent enzyme [Leifsonia sp. fls2-241-R2A-40a]|uniref:thiamine pyrophosphate-dependent enzyme n=1 Tax=Leifsonia sp. fls2-241-R2A-40a TaxID=3040290 RepID=UPI00254D5772|nr:thiamine pyrophosphate-dependent enzyme [Leifsonia sp. fls2-241-R2A-40a]
MTLTAPQRAAARPDDAALLRRLYRTMAIVRRLERDAIAMEGQGVSAAHVPLRGSEAAQVGGTAALDPAVDFVSPGAGELGVAVALGADPVAHLAARRGRGRWRGHLGNADTPQAVGDPAASSAVTHAVGWALAAKLDRTGGAALAYLGGDTDAATQGTVLRDAMDAAAASSLPVVFFLQDDRDIPVADHAVPAVRVDGDDVLAVYDATAEALDRARSGGGPTVILPITARSSDGAGPSLVSGETPRRPARDPLALCEQKLRQTGTVGDEFFAEVADTAGALADRVRDGALLGADFFGADVLREQ